MKRQKPFRRGGGRVLGWDWVPSVGYFRTCILRVLIYHWNTTSSMATGSRLSKLKSLLFSFDEDLISEQNY